MSYIPMRPILEAARDNSYANGAFNVNAVAQVEAALEIHKTFRAPALLQGAELANGFMGGCTNFFESTLEDKKNGAINLVKAINDSLKTNDVPVCLHLDHGQTFESVKAVIDAGYTSVMIDGSSLPFKENIELTREVVKYAHSLGVTVEGELGVLAGVEDHVFSTKSTYTNPLDAIKFFKDTKVDALAISYGTKHGANKGSDTVIRKEIALSIRECMNHEHIDGFLVSHGSSLVPSYIVNAINNNGGKVSNAHGISLEQLQEVSHTGINKINVDTDLRLAVTRNIRELFNKDEQLKKNSSIGEIWQLMQEKPENFDPRYYLTPIMGTLQFGDKVDEYVDLIVNEMKLGVKEVLGTLIVGFGAVGKAELVKEVTLEQMADFYKKQGL